MSFISGFLFLFDNKKLRVPVYRLSSQICGKTRNIFIVLCNSFIQWLKKRTKY